MSIFPSFDLDINKELNNNIEDYNYDTKTFLFDFKTGEFVFEDGKIKEVSGIDGLKVWIEKILRTEKFKFTIYKRKDKNEYGVLIKDFILGNKLPKDFIAIELQREVTNALLRNKLIKNLDNWNVEKNKRTLNISFRVLLNNNENFIKEITYGI